MEKQSQKSDTTSDYVGADLITQMLVLWGDGQTGKKNQEHTLKSGVS